MMAQTYFGKPNRNKLVKTIDNKSRNITQLYEDKGYLTEDEGISTENKGTLKKNEMSIKEKNGFVKEHM